MAKRTGSSSYICSVCGAMFSNWAGRCSMCGQWNTLELSITTATASLSNPLADAGLKSSNLAAAIQLEDQRLVTSIGGVDLVFGGGIVGGSVNLLSGEPGMGKSTLLLQLAAGVANHYPVIYVSGEESLHQVGLRAIRLGLVQSTNLKLASSNSADAITSEILKKKTKLVIVDSIQTLTCSDIGSSAGSVTQITNSSAMITRAAKEANCAVIIVGHVTKEGNLAGPKLLEHIVDVVLSLEGDSSGGLRLLRVSKNRFGSVNETAIFEMKDQGLELVKNPSAVLLEERKNTDGSVVLAAIEGSRPILVEVQALVNPTGYGYPKRAVSGFDLSRLNLLIAMIERRTNLTLKDKDIFVNIVGGIKINEPAADLAVVMAIASAARGKKLRLNAVVFGEIGLSGEIRHVPFIDKRVAEGLSLGFEAAIGPKPTLSNGKSNQTPLGLQPVTEVRSVLNEFLIK